VTAERTAVGIAQWLAEPGLGEQNLEAALGYVRELAEHGAELVVLPELWPSGYRVSSLGDDTRATAEPLDGPRGAALARVAVETGVWLAAGTVPELDGGTVYNSAVVYSPRGELVATHRKAYLYGSAEHEAFTAGDCLTTFEREPFGRVGLAVCFDGDFPELFRIQAVRGAEIICRPSALLRSADIWELTTRARAYDNHVYVIGANATGTDPAGVHYFGNSLIVTPIAEVVARAAAHEGWAAARLDPAGAMAALTPGSDRAQTFDHLAERNLGLLDTYQKDLIGQARTPFRLGGGA
jgi:predicted amidohydrolase